MTDTPDTNLWLAEGTMIYKLVETKDRRGRPQAENLFTISVTPGPAHTGATPERAQELAKRIAEFLRSENHQS